MSKTIGFTLKITADGTFPKAKMPPSYQGNYNIELLVHDDIRKSIRLNVSGKPSEQIEKMQLAILQELHRKGFIDNRALPKCGSDAEEISEALVKAMTGKTIGATRKAVEAAENESIILDKIPDPSVKTTSPDELRNAAEKAGLIKAANNGQQSESSQKATADLKKPRSTEIAASSEDSIGLDVINLVEKHFKKSDNPKYSDKNYRDMIALASDLVTRYVNRKITGQQLADTFLADCKKPGGFPDHPLETHKDFVRELYAQVAKPIKYPGQSRMTEVAP